MIFVLPGFVWPCKYGDIVLNRILGSNSNIMSFAITYASLKPWWTFQSEPSSWWIGNSKHRERCHVSKSESLAYLLYLLLALSQLVGDQNSCSLQTATSYQIKGNIIILLHKCELHDIFIIIGISVADVRQILEKKLLKCHFHAIVSREQYYSKACHQSVKLLYFYPLSSGPF